MKTFSQLSFLKSSFFCLISLSILPGCSSAKITPISKDHRIQKATEELDEWLHDHCKYVGFKEGNEKAREWANNTKVNFLEIIESHTDSSGYKEMIVGFFCETFPPIEEKKK